MHAGMIAAACPGFGNPLALPIDDFLGLLRRAGFLVKFGSGTLSDQDIVRYEGGLL